jgi:hypothetical protein
MSARYLLTVAILGGNVWAAVSCVSARPTTTLPVTIVRRPTALLDEAMADLNSLGLRVTRETQRSKIDLAHADQFPPGVRVVLVTSAAASRVGAVNTCLAFAALRTVVCSEQFIDDLPIEIEDRLKIGVNQVAGPGKELIAQAFRDHPKQVVHAVALGQLYLTLLHEVGHILNSDPLVAPKTVGPVVQSLCGIGENLNQLREAAADASAAAWLRVFRRKQSEKATDVVERSVLAVDTFFWAAPSDPCAAWKEVCVGSQTHPGLLGRMAFIRAFLDTAEHRPTAQLVGLLGSFQRMTKEGTCK